MNELGDSYHFQSGERFIRPEPEHYVLTRSNARIDLH